MTYIIAEAGQNHQGSVQVAMSLIDMAADPSPHGLGDHEHFRPDAIKFTKRDLSQECTASQMASVYDSPHAFGDTYGEHRAALELSNEEHAILYQYAKAQGLDFIETLCAIGCLDMLDHFQPDKIKVASRDLTNLPLLDALAETEIPLIISTGMADERDIEDALEVITLHHDDITILHCLSSYPAAYANLNLRSINALKTYGYPVGYSDHSIGIMAPVAAVALGACMIEKHVTIDRTMRGSDHEGSLERDGLWRMCRDIRHLEDAMGRAIIEKHPTTDMAQLKLERSLATSADLPAGTIITESDITLLSPGNGYRWRDRHRVIGREVGADVPRAELILPAHLRLCVKE